VDARQLADRQFLPVGEGGQELDREQFGKQHQVGAAILIESLTIKIFTGYPLDQPFSIKGGVRVGNILLPWQTLLNIGIAVIMMLVLGWLLRSTRLGRAIRATAQHRVAAQLMGVPVARVFVQVLVIAGVVGAISGVLLTGSVANLLPQVGTYPMLKAFFICVIAGLGNIPGAVLGAFVLAEFESGVSYLAGARYGFPAMFALANGVLIWRPYGVFGRRRVMRA
jgi:branched-chain amino acid transport system permease protein